MARPGKGARLYLRAGRVDHRTGRKIAAVYFIRDGQTNISTGCGPERLAEAEVALAEYMAAKRVAASATKRSADDPEDVLVADVVGLYAKEKGPLSADPKALAVRLAMILEWWGEKSLGDIRRSSCMAYVAHREVLALLNSAGFRHNRRKTVIRGPGDRRIVLGMLVNTDRPRLAQAFKNNLRLHLYYLTSSKHGPAAHAASRRTSISNIYHHVRGLISWARTVEPAYGDKLLKQFNLVDWPPVRPAQATLDLLEEL